MMKDTLLINIYCYLCECSTHYLPKNIRQGRKYLKTANILTQGLGLYYKTFYGRNLS
jgi:hypothetical protein